MASQTYGQGTLTPLSAKPKAKKKKPRPANQTVGAATSSPVKGKHRPANQNAGEGVARDTPRKHPPGRPFQWDNGSWHTRRQGAKYRTDAPGGPAAPGKPHKPVKHPLIDQANALADLRYGGAESSLNQRGQAIAPWYQNYMNEAGAAATAQQTYADPLVAQAQQRSADAGQQAPGLDPNTPAGHDAALAAAARNALGSAFVTTLQGVNQAQKDFYQGRKAVAATAEVGAQTQLARDKTDLAKEKGAYKASTLQDLRDKRRQARLENAAFGIKAATAANSAADKAAQLNKYGYTDNEWAKMSDAQRNKIRNKKASGSGPDLGNINKYGYTEKQWRGFSVAKRQAIIKGFDKSSGGKSDFTPKQVQDSGVKLRKAMGLVKGKLDGKTTAPDNYWEQAYSALVNELDYDPLLARAAIQAVRFGTPGPKIAKRLKREYGLTRLPHGKAFKKPPAYVLRPVTQAPGANGQQRPT